MDEIFSSIPQIISAASAKQPAAVLGLVLTLGVFLFKKYIGKVSPKLESLANTDPGGVILVMVGAFAAALSTSTTLDGATLKLAGAAAIAAMGGYSGLKKFIVPLLQYLYTKIWPSPVQQVEQQAAAQAAAKVKDESAIDALKGIK